MNLRRFDSAVDALAFAVGIIDDDLDRVDALGGAARQPLGNLRLPRSLRRLTTESR